MGRFSGVARRVVSHPSIASRREARRARRLHARLAGPKVLLAFGRAFPAARFVEIGANDGLQHDHLRSLIASLPWRGVMVEPVPYVFERLRANYERHPGVELENAAIGARDGTLPFFHLAAVVDRAAEELPRWYDGIGSLSREAVLSHARLIPDIEERIVETEVPVLTFDTLLAKHHLDDVDLVVIDTEGYDHVIVRQIDYARHRPVLLVYEHYHLGADERRAARACVEDAGYETREEGFDTWCLEAGADPALTRVWRASRPGAPGLYAEDEPP